MKKPMKKLKISTIKKLKPYWKKLQELEGEFNLNVHKLELKMQKDLNIDDLEFFWRDGYCGIGNEARTIKLIPIFIKSAIGFKDNKIARGPRAFKIPPNKPVVFLPALPPAATPSPAPPSAPTFNLNFFFNKS